MNRTLGAIYTNGQCSSFLLASGMDHGRGRGRLTTTNDDDVAQHGGHAVLDYRLQHISLILDLHILFN